MIPCLLKLIFAILGIIAMIIISRIDYRKYKKWSYLAFIIAAILLLLVITISPSTLVYVLSPIVTDNPSSSGKPLIVGVTPSGSLP